MSNDSPAESFPLNHPYAVAWGFIVCIKNDRASTKGITNDPLLNYGLTISHTISP